MKGENASVAVDKLMAEGRLYEGNADGQFTMAAKADKFENLDVFINTNFANLNSFVQSLLPESTRKQSLKEDIDNLFSDGIIEFLLGNGVLDSPDPLQMIKLHLFSIAGFLGLMINALSLLPIGNTDGGWICVTFFGCSFSWVVHGTALIALVLAGFFGADQTNIYLCSAIYCQIWQSKIEIPCHNEVDELDSVQRIVAIAVSLIAMLTLCPLPG